MAIVNALRKIPEPQRRAITLHYVLGAYAPAGVEWQNGTDDGSQCALMATFNVTPKQFPAGTPSLTDGPACASFKIHPITSGFDPSYFYPPVQPTGHEQQLAREAAHTARSLRYRPR